MKNVTCRKLPIDRIKAAQKLETLKDISLSSEASEFPSSGSNSGGLVARSLADIGKGFKQITKKKKQQQLMHFLLQGPLVPLHLRKSVQETPDTRQRASREVYSVHFLQHELEQ